MAVGRKHDPIKVALILTTICIYIVVLVMNQLSSRKSKNHILVNNVYFKTAVYLKLELTKNKKVLFPTDVGSISRLFPLDITPIGLVFPIIWSTIYLWQVQILTLINYIYIFYCISI